MARQPRSYLGTMLCCKSLSTKNRLERCIHIKINKWGSGQIIDLLYSFITLLATCSNPEYSYNESKDKAQRKTDIEEKSTYLTRKVVLGSSSAWPPFLRWVPPELHFARSSPPQNQRPILNIGEI